MAFRNEKRNTNSIEGIDVNKKGGARDGGALTVAAFKGHLDMVKFLYDNGAILDVSTFARNPLIADSDMEVYWSVITQIKNNI